MNKLMIMQNPDDSPVFTRKAKRGAKVCGLPLSKELVSYLDDAVPQASQQRIIDMFFAGRFSPVCVDEEQEQEEDY